MFRDDAKEVCQMSILDRVREVSYQTGISQYIMEDDDRIREEWLKRQRKLNS